MGGFENLKGMSFGCWYVVSQAEYYDGKADLRVQWNVECTKCYHKFKMVSRTLKRRRIFPTYCENCKPVIKANLINKKEPERNINGFAIKDGD